MIGRLSSGPHLDLTLTPSLCLQEVQKCDLPSIYITQNSGCRTLCAVTVWQPQCCHGYYGRDCLGETTSTCVSEVPFLGASVDFLRSFQCAPVEFALPAVTTGHVTMVTWVTALAPVTQVMWAWPVSCAVMGSMELPVKVGGDGSVRPVAVHA